MIRFSQLETSNVILMLALEATIQLYRTATFARAGTTDVEGVPINQYFEKGQTTNVKRIKDFGAAEDYEPRSGTDASTFEAEYVFAPLTLEKLFTKAHPVYSPDAAVETYVKDFGKSIGGSIRKSFDDYLYLKGFRDYASILTLGAVAYGDKVNAPLALVYQEDTNGNLTVMNRQHLLNVATVLQTQEVPNDMNLFGRVSPTAGQGLQQDATLVTGFAGALAAEQPGTGLIVDGLGLGVDFMREGFMVAKSNAIKGQPAVADVGGSAATTTVTAAVADTTVFLAANTSLALGLSPTSVPLGAVRLTLTATPAVTLAVGQIARLGAVGSPCLARGVILRIDAANKYVWLVPYAPNGTVLDAAQIPTSIVFSVPFVGSVNPFFHKEHLLYATRPITPPSDGSGAVVEYMADPQSNVILQILKGSYNVNQFKETIRGALLCGGVGTDYRKAALVLSA